MEWISVKEKLPEREGAYLTFGRGTVLSANKAMHVGLFCYSPYQNKVAFSQNVTHWMELPEVPEDKSDD